MAMLSEEEKREMKEMAQSSAIREEFEKVRSLSQLPRSEPVDLDQLVAFLTFMSRLSPHPLPHREPLRYSRTYL